MSLPVFVVADAAAAVVGATLTVDGDEGRHATTVRRIRPGERIALTDGAGTRLTAVVLTAGKGSLEAEVEAVQREPRQAPHLTVVQAIPKGDRGELAVEMLTEIGADRIVPWAASRSVAIWRGDRAAKSEAKWRHAARSAAKQSRRSWFPEVTPMADTAQAALLAAEAELAVVLHEEAEVPLAKLIGSAEHLASVAIVVGPEGGISDEELDALAPAVPVRLGTEVLRTSTAGVAAAAALLAGTRWR